MIKTIKILPLVSAISLLSACGGGGSSSASEAATTTAAGTTYPVRQAMTTVFTHGLQQTLNVTGTVNSGTETSPLGGSITFTLSGATSATFDGAPALQLTRTTSGSLIVNGTSSPFDATVTDYLNASYAPIGSYTSDSSEYCFTDKPGEYPVTAVVGQKGTVFTSTCFSDSTKKTPTSTGIQTYEVTAGAGSNTVNVQLVTKSYSANVLTGTEAVTFALTSTGASTLTQYAISGTEGGMTINLTAKVQ